MFLREFHCALLYHRSDWFETLGYALYMKTNGCDRSQIKLKLSTWASILLVMSKKGATRKRLKLTKSILHSTVLFSRACSMGWCKMIEMSSQLKKLVLRHLRNFVFPFFDSSEGQHASLYKHGEDQATLPAGQWQDTGSGLNRDQYWYSNSNSWNDNVMDDCATIFQQWQNIPSPRLP